MVAATQPPPPQQQQQQQQQQQTPTITAEEEALKRNTDCVYFLASPLTCKKGSECEYRHSEYARINPRDCYFWLNGNCLNPKCGFRHPPLDGLLGTQTAPSSGSSLPPLQTAVIPATHAPQSSGKQAVPCIFFQKGLCLKGDRCAFLHGPNPTSNKSPQLTVATTATEPPSLKKAFGGLQKFTQEQKIPATNVSKVVGVTLEAKHGPKVETAPPRNGMGIERNVAPPTGLSEEVPRYKATNVPSVVNGNSVSRSNRLHQINVSDDHGLQNGKDADEFLRESSPGFDVLVDDELRDSDYYHGEDQFGRTRGHEGRNLNSVDEYNIGLSADYNSMADVDREMFRDPRGYDSYDHMQGQYGWEQHRTSTERMLVGPSHLERRGYAKSESPDHIDESDLRYRLSKQRGVNGLRSVVSHDYIPDNHVEERSYRGSSRRDSHHLPQHESSLSRRLRGRIKLPVRSPVNDSDLLAEREMDRGRSRSRLSPGRPQISSHEGRLHDRIKGRVEENYNEGRNLRGPRMRREIIDDRRSDFARPKSLAELKVKNVENKENNSLRKRKSLEDHQQSEGDLSFEGPMPLSEILKRKRKAGAAAFGSGMSSVNEEENNNIAVAATEGTADDVGTAEEKTEVAHDQPSELANVGDLETEDAMIGDDGMEDHELEGDDQRDGEYEYEQVDEEGDYNYEEGENADAEEEYLEEEDGDDFAKKIGVMFS